MYKKLFLLIAFALIANISHKSHGQDNIYFFTKSNYINAHTGPENFYKIKIIYRKKYLLLRVVNEYNDWYQVEDIEGEKSWIYRNFLSKQKKKQYVSIKEETFCYKKPTKSSQVAFKSGYLVNFQLKYCHNEFCLLSKEKIEGWCEKSKLWGL